MRSIGSQKHGTDKRLVITTACCIDDPRTVGLNETVTLSLLEKLDFARFRSCFFFCLLFLEGEGYFYPRELPKKSARPQHDMF